VINNFCPKCNALTSMTTTVTESNEKNDEGKSFKVTTTSYYCNRCHAFVRSEDNKTPLNSEEA
jgi:hypothetical protein